MKEDQEVYSSFQGSEADSIELYEATSSSYDELYREEQYGKYKYVESSGITISGTVVDVGCGTGLLLEYLLSRGALLEKYICIEPSSEMISRVFEKAVDYRVLAIRALAQANPIRDGVASITTLITVWDNIVSSDRLRALMESLRVTKTGAPVVLSFIKHRFKEALAEVTGIAQSTGLRIEFIGCESHDCIIIALRN
ncbi:MAG: class I SAM-dependent methyltransferase [Desulfurococcaceae archaeon]